MIELGLQRISRLLSRTPLPWRAIHVAGTNGKGSICNYVSSMLETYNKFNRYTNKDSSHPRLTHGRFTSPHLIDRWDCISVNQETIPFNSFQCAENRVLERNEKETIGASEFELLTATAFEVFAQENVDVAVIEVGMGGRLDATNIIGQTEGLHMPEGREIDSFRPPPLVTAISSIGLDHQAFLGDTVEQIAREKAGIIKIGVPVVVDDSNLSTVVKTIKDIAMAKGCEMLVFDWEEQGFKDDEVNRIETRLNSIEPWHKRTNVQVAFVAVWAALQELGRLNFHASNDDKNRINASLLASLAHDMLKKAGDISNPGRQQKINLQKLTRKDETVLLDGAHNAQSAAALASTVEELREYYRCGIAWVLAASDSKDAKEILTPLLKDGDTVFAVEFGPVDGMPWVKPVPSSRLIESAQAVVSQPESLIVQDHGRNISVALEALSREQQPKVIAGSLYLVGDVLRLLRQS